MIRIGLILALTMQCVLSECNDWVDYEGFCFSFRKNELSWDLAGAACTKSGARLVQIDREEKQTWLASQLRNQSIIRAWTGARCRNDSELWEWVPSLTPLNYTNWNTGEPNTPEVTKCAVLIKAREYKWDDVHCYNNYTFICEKRANPTCE